MMQFLLMTLLHMQLPSLDEVFQLWLSTLRYVPSKYRPAFARVLSVAIRPVELENTLDAWTKVLLQSARVAKQALWYLCRMRYLVTMAFGSQLFQGSQPQSQSVPNMEILGSPGGDADFCASLESSGCT